MSVTLLCCQIAYLEGIRFTVETIKQQHESENRQAFSSAVFGCNCFPLLLKLGQMDDFSLYIQLIAVIVLIF